MHWVKKGGRNQPFYETMFFGGNEFTYSTIGLCDNNGVVPEACVLIQTNGTGHDVGPIDRDRSNYGLGKITSGSRQLCIR